MIRFIPLFIVFISTAFAEDNKRIQYKFTLTEPQHHLAQVDITFPNVSTKTFVVKLPVWRTGRYEILNLSKNISQFSAQHSNGEKITWQKSDKNTWKLFLNQPGSLTISYQVYANQLKQRVTHIDSTHAYLDASGVFMFAPTKREQALSVNLMVPTTWQSISGMEKTSEHQFIAANFDQLIDSPIETGIHEYLKFELDEQTYEIVIWGDGNHDINDLKSQVSLMHHAAKDIWETFPFKRYVYMYHSGDGLRGATEHVNSTIIQQDRFNFKPREKYLKVLATTAHEFIHTWNVKAYRPAGIAPYNYSKENYSSLFWMAEGITSYYDDLFLIRTGIYKKDDYYNKLATGIQKHLANPGRKKQSLAQSSFDTWLKKDAQQLHNSNVSIYLEGSLVAWKLDQQIRQQSNNNYGLDELQRRLYNEHNNIDKGYDKLTVLNLLKDITDTEFNEFWLTYVEGTQTIDFDELLKFYGLQMVPKVTDQENTWIGATMDTSNDSVEIKTVDSDSPAWTAGLTAGDQIIAIDGIKVKPNDIKDRIKQLTPEQTYQLHYFHAGQLMETTLSPVVEPYPELTIKPVSKPSRKQKQHHKSWTGQALTVK